MIPAVMITTYLAARAEYAEEIADVATVGVEGVARGVALGAEGAEEFVERALGLHPAIIGGAQGAPAKPGRPERWGPLLTIAAGARGLVRAIETGLLVDLLLVLHLLPIVVALLGLVVVTARAG